MYFGEFTSAEDVFERFCVPDHDRNITIVAAWYVNEDYCGDAEVYFIKDGELYEVLASHCSCYGLEKKWVPDLVEPIELQGRLERKDIYGPRNRDTYKVFLDLVMAEVAKRLPV